MLNIINNSKYWNNFLTFMAIASVFLIYVLFFNRNRTIYSVSSKYTTAQSNICSKQQGKLVLLNDTQISFPRCIDGSLPGYYIRNGYGEGRLKWAVYFEGGGWCYDLKACFLRGKTNLGSSRKYERCIGPEDMQFYTSGISTENPMMYNWNTVRVKYCDGSSYAGNAIQQFEGHDLFFMGQVNRDSTIRSLLTNGMAEASQIVISGCSAGGLGVYLGIDQMADIIHQANPKAVVRGLADSGFFLDHTSNLSTPVTHNPFGYDEASVNGKLDYSGAMKRVFQFTNMKAGAHPACILAQRGTQEELCVFAENLVSFIRTPIFAIQPQFDEWQVHHVIGYDFSADSVNEFGSCLVTLMQSRFLSNSLTVLHGAFIDSCVHHCMFCSEHSENPWIGSNIHSTFHSKYINPATAFHEWFSFSLLGDRERDLYSITNQLERRFSFQNFSFPCNTCCLCKI